MRARNRALIDLRLIGLLFIGWALLGLFGCAAYPMRFASQNSQVEFPGQAVDSDLPAGSVFRVSSNPDSNQELDTYYPDGTQKMRYRRDRAAAYDAFGNQVTRIEDNRQGFAERVLEQILSVIITEGLPRYDARAAARPSPQDSVDLQNQAVQNQINALGEGLKLLTEAVQEIGQNDG